MDSGVPSHRSPVELDVVVAREREHHASDGWLVPLAHEVEVQHALETNVKRYSSVDDSQLVYNVTHGALDFPCCNILILHAGGVLEKTTHHLDSPVLEAIHYGPCAWAEVLDSVCSRIRAIERAGEGLKAASQERGSGSRFAIQQPRHGALTHSAR